VSTVNRMIQQESECYAVKGLQYLDIRKLERLTNLT